MLPPQQKMTIVSENNESEIQGMKDKPKKSKETIFAEEPFPSENHKD